MRRLETRSGAPEHEMESPPRLDFLQPSDQPGVLGRFGPYEIVAHVASGGMGIVLKARDQALNRIVALKILEPTLAANTLARARFVREARAAAAVVHEHVVPIYAVDESAGLPYIVMQFVQGQPLSDRIRATGPLRLEEVLRIGAQTAAGLAAAHAQGLIHRDIKPGNILLENSVERVKLTDFGLARAVDDTGLTRTGELAGTPEFMAPEQAANEAVDHRSDLFSFGSVLYAMCTGHSPFHASSVIAAVRKVCDARPPPVHEVNPAIPRWFNDIVARLMAKSPAERFQSAREVAS
ncbi:MAG: serine/threonine protein kinase [Verrucomicrobia subdivision 3 bacterium]|nr:serine/threonine protein kinase [Limisphaerales bacterium]